MKNWCSYSHMLLSFQGLNGTIRTDHELFQRQINKKFIKVMLNVISNRILKKEHALFIHVVQL